MKSVPQSLCHGCGNVARASLIPTRNNPEGTAAMADEQSGRPSSYIEGYAEQAEKLCVLGATDSEIADFFGVSVRTIHRWKLEHEDFCHSIKSGKAQADDRVERSLYQKATGYDYVEEQAIKIKVEQHKEQVEVVEVVKHAPADTTAGIFWLKNRRKEDWRDKQEHEHSGMVQFQRITRRIVDPTPNESEGA